MFQKEAFLLVRKLTGDLEEWKKDNFLEPAFICETERKKKRYLILRVSVRIKIDDRQEINI